jgi:phosphocarrier protein HPr
MPFCEKTLLIQNKRGLHARASAKFVQCAEQFQSFIEVEREGSKVSARSIMGLMMLAASQGTTIHVTANGVDAQEGLDALEALVNRCFDEE